MGMALPLLICSQADGCGLDCPVHYIQANWPSQRRAAGPFWSGRCVLSLALPVMRAGEPA